MAKPLQIVAGQKFGRLTAVESVGRLTRGNAWTTAWRFTCECGGEKIAGGPEVCSGKVSSCGCWYNGRSKKRGHGSYQQMMRRCHNPKSKDYHRYGGRGISVCDRWRFGDGVFNGPELFFRDMGEPATQGLSLERIDNNRGYAPDNCRWASAHEQALNKRNNYFEPGVDPRRVCADAGVRYGTFRQRVSKGWSFSEALVASDFRKIKRV